MATTEVSLACRTLSFAFLKKGWERYIWKGPQHWHSVPNGWFALQRADHMSLQGSSSYSKKHYRVQRFVAQVYTSTRMILSIDFCRNLRECNSLQALKGGETTHTASHQRPC
jgi:hypothetical protein